MLHLPCQLQIKTDCLEIEESRIKILVTFSHDKQGGEKVNVEPGQLEKLKKPCIQIRFLFSACNKFKIIYEFYSLLLYTE